MKRISALFMSLLTMAGATAQTADPIVMRVDGKYITLSEFEYSYKKNCAEGVLEKKTLDEYVDLFVNLKLKVAEALRQKIDTIPAVRSDLDNYVTQTLLPKLVDTTYIEREARRMYDNSAARLEGADVLTASHILVMLRQDATDQQTAAAKARIDSIYNVLKAVPKEDLPKRFAELAETFSEDRGSARRGGALGQFGKGRMIPDFERAAYATPAGEMSEPFLSTVGYHIIYMTDRHPLESYDFYRPNIMRTLESRGVREASAKAAIDAYMEEKGVTRAQAIEEIYEKILADDPELRQLDNEYRDGTLMFEVSKREVWNRAQADVEGQEAYFNAHKKSYKWDEPRFSGIVVYAKDESVFPKAKKLLKGVKEEDYATTLVAALNSDSVKQVRIEVGLFQPGMSPNVDRLAFKKKDVELKPQTAFPAVNVYGKVIKKPRKYQDVKAAVLSDYQRMLEQEWVETLRQRFAVEVYKDALDPLR